MIRASIIMIKETDSPDSLPGIFLSLWIPLPRPPIDSSYRPALPVGYKEGEDLPSYYLESLAAWKKSRLAYEAREIVYQDLLDRIKRLRLGEVLLQQEPLKYWTMPEDYLSH